MQTVWGGCGGFAAATTPPTFKKPRHSEGAKRLRKLIIMKTELAPKEKSRIFVESKPPNDKRTTSRIGNNGRNMNITRTNY
jgi:hypothetical protein